MKMVRFEFFYSLSFHQYSKYSFWCCKLVKSSNCFEHFDRFTSNSAAMRWKTVQCLTNESENRHTVNVACSHLFIHLNFNCKVVFGPYNWGNRLHRSRSHKTTWITWFRTNIMKKKTYWFRSGLMSRRIVRFSMVWLNCLFLLYFFHPVHQNLTKTQ